MTIKEPIVGYTLTEQIRLDLISQGRASALANVEKLIDKVYNILHKKAVRVDITLYRKEIKQSLKSLHSPKEHHTGCGFELCPVCYPVDSRKGCDGEIEEFSLDDCCGKILLCTLCKESR